jgi:hypothetical protein
VAELSPSAPDVQLQLGLCAREAGDLVLAERALRAAMADTPDQGYPVAQLALLLVSSGRWPEAEALLGTLSRDLPDASKLVRPCYSIAMQIVQDYIAGMPGSHTGDEVLSPDYLTERAHWLDLLTRTLTLAVTGQRTEVVIEVLGNLQSTLAFLWQVPATPDSPFARAVRDLDMLLDRYNLLSRARVMRQRIMTPQDSRRK